MTAFISYFPSMCHHMLCETIFNCKRTFTLTALVWLVPSVCSKMIY